MRLVSLGKILTQAGGGIFFFGILRLSTINASTQKGENTIMKMLFDVFGRKKSAGVVVSFNSYRGWSRIPLYTL